MVLAASQSCVVSTMNFEALQNFFKFWPSYAANSKAACISLISISLLLISGALYDQIDILHIFFSQKIFLKFYAGGDDGGLGGAGGQ